MGCSKVDTNSTTGPTQAATAPTRPRSKSVLMCRGPNRGKHALRRALARARLIGNRSKMASEKLPAVEDDRGVFVIGHAEFLGTAEAAQGDLARRRLPRRLVGPLPAVMAPAPRRRVLQRRTAIMANARSFGSVCLNFRHIGADLAQVVEPERQPQPCRAANSRSFTHT